MMAGTILIIFDFSNFTEKEKMLQRKKSWSEKKAGWRPSGSREKEPKVYEKADELFFPSKGEGACTEKHVEKGKADLREKCRREAIDPDKKYAFKEQETFSKGMMGRKGV